MHKNINPKSLHKHMGTKHNIKPRSTKHNRLNNINNVYKRLNQDYKL